MTREVNSLGNPQHYGPRTADKNMPAGVLSNAPFKTLEVEFTYADAIVGLPILNASVDKSQLVLPAGATVARAYLQVVEAWTTAAGGNAPALRVGLSNKDGTSASAVSLTTQAKAALTANTTITLAGAAIGAGVGAVDRQLIIDAIAGGDPSGNFITGSARLVVEFLPNHY